MKVKFESFDSFKYRQVFQIIEYRDGAIFKTKFIGYAKADRPLGKDELYSSLSTKITKQHWIELDLLD